MDASLLFKNILYVFIYTSPIKCWTAEHWGTKKVCIFVGEYVSQVRLCSGNLVHYAEYWVGRWTWWRLVLPYIWNNAKKARRIVNGRGRFSGQSTTGRWGLENPRKVVNELRSMVRLWRLRDNDFAYGYTYLVTWSIYVHMHMMLMMITTKTSLWRLNIKGKILGNCMQCVMARGKPNFLFYYTSEESSSHFVVCFYFFRLWGAWHEHLNICMVGRSTIFRFVLNSFFIFFLQCFCYFYPLVLTFVFCPLEEVCAHFRVRGART